MNIRSDCKGKFPKVDFGTFHAVALGNGTKFDIILNEDGGALIVSIMRKGCYPFSGFAHAGYVNEKLGIDNECDAGNVADFINDQLGLHTDRQGEYAPCYVN